MFLSENEYFDGEGFLWQQILSVHLSYFFSCKGSITLNKTLNIALLLSALALTLHIEGSYNGHH